MKLAYIYNNEEISLAVERNQNELTVQIGEKTYQVHVDAVRDTTAQFRIDDNAYFAHFAMVSESERIVALQGKTYQLEKKDSRKVLRRVSDSDIPQDVTAPMPGQIIAVEVAVGDEVTEGQPLIVMEAMKMEYTLRAPQDGTMTAVHCEKGQQVDLGTVLVDIENETEE